MEINIIVNIIASPITLIFILSFLSLLLVKTVDTQSFNTMYYMNLSITTTNNTLSNVPGPCGEDPTNLSCQPPSCLTLPSQPECTKEEGTPNITEIKKLLDRLNSEKP